MRTPLTFCLLPFFAACSPGQSSQRTEAKVQLTDRNEVIAVRERGASLIQNATMDFEGCHDTPNRISEFCRQGVMADRINNFDIGRALTRGHGDDRESDVVLVNCSTAIGEWGHDSNQRRALEATCPDQNSALYILNALTDDEIRRVSGASSLVIEFRECQQRVSEEVYQQNPRQLRVEQIQSISEDLAVGMCDNPLLASFVAGLHNN